MPSVMSRTATKPQRLAPALAFAVGLSVALGACGSDSPATIPTQQPSATRTQQPSATASQSTSTTAVPTDIKVAFSPKARETADVPDAELSELVSGNTQFALDLYQQLGQQEGNLFYSPYSISLALAMTYAGARGETEQQIRDTLNFTLPQDRLHPAFNALDQRLASLSDDVEQVDGTAFRLSIANSIWGEQTFEFVPEFLDTLAVNYGAGLRLVDFIHAHEQSRQVINAWVEDQTEDRVKDLLPEDVITDMTRLVLANAIYFKASWVEPFDEEDTAPGEFTLLDGSTVTTPMMHNEIRTNYGDGNGWQAVDLPYVGWDVSMVLILPDEGEFADFEAGLDAELLDEVLSRLGDTEVTLTMPKFEFESEAKLQEALSAMGMPIAFIEPSAGGADFTGLYPERRLYIEDVVHKAFVAVDEKGTEAAAATGVIIANESAPPSATMTLDRPFIFLIRDYTTDTVLFMGRVVEPGS